MRVIAGEFRSRRLKSLPGPHLRPTPDRLRETLFDILASRIEGVTFLDAYAGTGAVGIEALSRGAREAIFIERSRAAADLIRGNLQSLGIETRAQVFCAKALVVLERQKAEIVFLDPPYDLAAEYAAALALLGAAPPPLTIVQHDVRLDLRDEYGHLRRTRTVRQGDNVLSFYAEILGKPMPIQMTRAEVAKCLEDFLEGRGGRWDWDDFTSIRIKDPDLESIRLRCASLPESYPPRTPRHYCNEEGMAVLRALLANLSE